MLVFRLQDRLRDTLHKKLERAGRAAVSLENPPSEKGVFTEVISGHNNSTFISLFTEQYRSHDGLRVLKVWV